MEVGHKDLVQAFYMDFLEYQVKELSYEAYHLVAVERVVVDNLAEAP